MPVGSHCLFTATVELVEPSSTYPTFDDFDPTWTETRDPDDVYSLNSGNIRVAEAGRYLVTVGLHTDSLLARLAIHTRCRKNTDVIEKSYAVGNARNSSNPNIFTKSEFIIDLAANDDIDIQWTKKELDTGLLVPENTYIQLVRLTDSVHTAYASYSDGTDIAGYDSATAVPAPFDTIDEETDTNVIQRHATNDDEFLLKGVIGDRFLVLASVYFEGAEDRHLRDLNATLDGTQINGVGSQFYVRNSDLSDGSLNVSFIVTKKSNSDETLRITLENPLGPVTTLVRVINQSGLHIMKLLPTTEIAVFYDSTGDELVEGVTQLINVWNDEDERDAASFVRTDANTLTIQKTGTYICGSNVHAERVATVLRSNYIGEFVVNGAVVIEGNHGCYSKSVPRAGFNILGILEISATQTLEVQVRIIGQAGAGAVTLANRTGAWVINAETLTNIVDVSVSDSISIIEDTPKIEKEITRTETFFNGESVILDKGFVVSESFLSSDSQINIQSLIQDTDSFSLSEQLIIEKTLFLSDVISNTISTLLGKSLALSDTLTHSMNIIVRGIVNVQDALSISSLIRTIKSLKILDLFSLLKQNAVPISDSANPGGWDDSVLGNNDGFLFDELDGIIPEDDDNIAVSLDNPAIPENYFEVNIGSISDPLQDHGHKILFRAKGNGFTNSKVEIYQGITLIATTPEFILQSEYTTHVYYLSESEAATITDYSDLKLRVVPN